MEQIALCYQAAAALLTAAAQGLGYASLPATIPLRLRADTGTLVSGLAPALTGRGNADALAQELAEWLSLAGTPFERAEAHAGLVQRHISPHWG
ncbi:MAG: hypothetical protein LIO45_05975, partial [Clostridiales bacterium]|nr:hypothetical protein [Clostridiales bacterium]